MADEERGSRGVRRWIGVLIAALLMAGCVNLRPASDVADDSDPTEAPSSEESAVAANATAPPRELPTGDNASSPVAAPAVPTFSAPVVLPPAGGPVAAGDEPSIVVSPDDHVFVATTVAFMWRSLDGGATFEGIGADACYLPPPGIPDLLPECPPGFRTQENGIVGPSDGAIAVAADGRLLWAGLNDGDLAVPFQYSVDGGTTWSPPVDVALGNRSDRQWMAVAPDGAVHVVWRDEGAEAEGSLVEDDGFRPRLIMRTSHDNGESWLPPRPIYERRPPTGPIVAAPSTGDLYLPVSDSRLGVLRSLDGGANWERRDLPTRAIEPFLLAPFTRSLFPMAAVDDAGILYLTWAADEAPPNVAESAVGKWASVPGVYLASSQDGGDSWNQPRLLSSPGRAAVMPTLIAGAAGRVAVAWYESSTGDPPETVPSDWRVMYAQSHAAHVPDAPFVHVAVTPEPMHAGTICTSGLVCTFSDRSLGDFFHMALRPNGRPIIAWTQDAQPPHENLQETDVVVARMLGGDALR